VIIAGLPLDQKIVQHGPFVLTTEEGIHQAVNDFYTHSNGFERAKGWQSKNGRELLG
jgi:redox-sensitive bicupin YhaK (pirin superfamily)